MTSRTELAELQSKIDKAAQIYYSGSPGSGITDQEYDSLIAKLREIAPEDERLTRVGPPYSPEEMRTKVDHPIPMGSLDNTDDGINGYGSWDSTMPGGTLLQSRRCVSLKIDGSSIRLRYKDGKLVEAATRGNGEVGEIITANVAKFMDVPTVLPYPYSCDVRGEAILYIDEYRKIMEREYGKPFDEIPENERSNPRNLGNGIIGRDDGTDSDKMRFIAFDIFHEAPFHFQSDKFLTLRDLGFNDVPYRICDSRDEVIAFYEETLARRDSLPFEIDGLVVMVDSIHDQNQFVTDDIKSVLRPKYARAIKFPHKSNTTVLKDVLLTVGHTGAIIPTAVLEEVRIGGVNVVHALLNNWDEIERLGIAIGDEVEVVLAGDIIPKITRVIREAEGRLPIPEPTECPSCNSMASRRSLGDRMSAAVYCTNSTCYKMMIQKIDHWIGSSKKGVGILGIGSTILRTLWNNGLVQDPADLYTLTVDQIKDLETKGGGRIGESRASDIVKNIASKKVLSLSTFLGSLGIELLGRRRVQILQEAAGGRLDTIEDWLDDINLASLNIEGFGDTIKAAVRDGINRNRELIAKLLSVGVTTEEHKMTSNSTGSMSGVSFCFTGTRECIAEVTALGAVVVSSVAKSKPSPDYLVQKDPTSTSGKTKNAEANGHTKIISLNHLKQVLAGNAQLDGRSYHMEEDEPESMDANALASQLLD